MRSSISKLPFFCALLLCASIYVALGASSASAATFHQCEKTGGLSGETKTIYSDDECTIEDGEGEYQTVPIFGTQKIKAVQTKNFVLTTKIAGVNVEITCGELSSEGMTAANALNGAEMVATAEGVLKLMTCTVNKPTNCTVSVPIKTTKLRARSEGMSIKWEPPVGNTAFASFTLANCGALNGTHVIEGTAKSETKSTTTQEFNAGSGSALKVGSENLTLTGSYHLATEKDGTKLALETP